MTKTTTTRAKKQKTTTAAPELARLELPVTQRGLEVYAASPEDVIGRAADSKATVVKIPLAQIVESGDNARRTFDESEIQGLAQNIRAVGLRDAVEVKPRGERDDGSPAKYELVDGARRYRAFQLLYKLDPDAYGEIPAFVRDDNELTTAVVRAAKNHQRVQLTPYEEALDFQNVIARGATVEQCAALVGKSANTIKTRLALLDVPEQIARAVGGSAGVTMQHAAIAHSLLKSEVLASVKDDVAKQLVALTNEKRGDHLATPEDVQHRVLHHLESAGKIVELTSYEVEKMLKHDAQLRKATQDLPRLKTKTWNGHDEYVPATPELTKALKEAEKREEERHAKEMAKYRSGGSAYSSKEADKLRVYRKVRSRSRDAIVKATKSIVQFDDRVRDLALLALLNRVNVSKDAKVIAEAAGVDVKLIGHLHDDKKLIALIQELAKKKDKGQALARLVASVALVNLSESLGTYNPKGSDAWNHAAKTWIGGDMKQLAEKIRKEEQAAKKKGGKKAAAKKSAPNDEDDDVEEE